MLEINLKIISIFKYRVLVNSLILVLLVFGGFSDHRGDPSIQSDLDKRPSIFDAV